jgi:hypothetical protein
MGFRLITQVGMATKDPKVLMELAQGFLRGVVANNRVIIREALKRGRRVPPLYSSGVRYEREPWAGKFEEFADILTVLKRGWGDCDDLAAWRVAELQEMGENADIRIYTRPVKRKNQRRMMHVVVRRASGEIEDPSRYLGL